MNFLKKTGVFALFILLFVGLASAADTRINITMSETVYQNVTFAYDFDLTEGGSPLDYCQIDGVINITNPSTDSISDIYLTYFNGTKMTSNFTHAGGRTGTQINGSAGVDDYIILHIPELRSGNFTVFNYTINCTNVPPPLNISTSYSNPEFNINKKVLAGHNWTVTQTAKNDLLLPLTIQNINITINSQGVTWNGSTDNFTLIELNRSGDWSNVTGNGTNNRTWNWVVGGGNLAQGASQNITYVVRAPDNVPTSATYLALLEDLTYTVDILASNLTLTDVKAVADVDLELDKKIIQPSNNNNNTNVTWEVSTNVSVPINLTYNLTKVTVWVTENLDPTNTSTYGGQNLTQYYYPNAEINQTVDWTNSGNKFRFNFTDASVGERPPIVWLRPYFTLLNDYNQIINSSITQNGQDLYMKYIYVVNGYWLEINKNVTSIDDDTYRIDTIVENIGTAWTPNGTVVTVYDFIPKEFAVWNMNPTNDSSSSVEGTGFNGTAYRWTIPMKMPYYNSSLGPKNGAFATNPGNYSWNVTYYVNGSGEYKVSELYVVGLDPRKVDGAGTHEGITLVSGFKSSTSEVFYIAVVFFLVVINLVNFVMTRRINDKLNKKHR